MKDNIGNELHIGDRVFCYSGKHKNEIQTIASFRIIADVLGDTEAVNFVDGGWLTALNVLSLNALGIGADAAIAEAGSFQDALGHTLHIGDQVLYLHAMEMYTQIGTVKKMAAKSCLLSIEHNRFDQTEYRKKYEEIISLTAIGKEDLSIAGREL